MRLTQFPLWFLCLLTSSSLACPFLYQLRQDPARFVLSGTQHIRERRPRWEQLGSDTWDRGGLLATWRRAAQEQGGGERGLFLHFLPLLSRACQSPLFCALFPSWPSLSRQMSIEENILRTNCCNSSKKHISISPSSARLPLRFGDHFTA